MNTSLSVWFIILLSFFAANLPFLNERIFAIIPTRNSTTPRPGKSFWIRLLELASLYAGVGVIAYALESRIGNPALQKWEFYAISIFLFIVMAYPGFVYRYLRKHHG